MTAAPSEWQTATDPATGAQYWFNPTTSESTWEPPAGLGDDTQQDQGNSKAQQLATLLANGEQRLKEKQQRQLLEAAQRAAEVEADRGARAAQAAFLDQQRRDNMAANKAGAAKVGKTKVGVAPQAKNAILAMNAAKSAKKAEAEANATPSILDTLNPFYSGVVWYQEPSLVLFFSAKVGLILYALFVGFHNQYAGDFGPFIQIHDGQVDFGAAATEWARLHTNQFAPK